MVSKSQETKKKKQKEDLIIKKEVKKRLLSAFIDNNHDLTEAKDSDDIEEEQYCEGYKDALLFVFSLTNINLDKK